MCIRDRLNENYKYKMTIVQRDGNNDKTIISNFIRDILELNKDVEYLSFYFEDNVYIVFYLECSEVNLINKLTEDIISKADSLVENDKSVFDRKGVLENVQTRSLLWGFQYLSLKHI